MTVNATTLELRQPVPNTDDASGLVKEDRVAAEKFQNWIIEQYRWGLDRRRSSWVRWQKVQSILNGVHYFTTAGGVYRPFLRRKDDAVVPVMDPLYRRELGRLNGSQLGVTALPRIGRGAEAVYAAMDAQPIMETWADETDLQAFGDTANQMLLVYGKVGYQRVLDTFEQTSRLVAVPGCNLFPIPFDAASFEEADGIIRTQMVSREWLERQDELFKAKHGRWPEQRMASMSSSTQMGQSSTGTDDGRLSMFRRRINGARVMHVWFKRSSTYPGGARAFFVEDQLMRFAANADGEGNPVLPGGRIPIEIVDYDQRPDEWWGPGFCEKLIAPQLEANRQMTIIVKAARYNRSLTFYDAEMIDNKKIGPEENNFIPVNWPFESRNPPVAHFPAPGVDRNVGVVMDLVANQSRFAVGYDSDIIFGQQEGRTEGGPATNLLNANAQAPLQSTLDRMYRAYERTFPHVLDMIGKVWPKDKIVRTVTFQGYARSRAISRDKFPTSELVVLQPLPLLADGRSGIVNIAFRMRSMLNEKGVGPLLSDREFRGTLRHAGIQLPGVEITDKAEQRISIRIAMLVNDGQTPAEEPVGPSNEERFALEDHELAITLLKDAILSPAFTTYAPPVQKALNQEIRFHRSFVYGSATHPDAFDDDQDQQDALSAEKEAFSREEDPSIQDGLMSMLEQPLGV
jgi:hypothetical protein